MSTTGTAVMLAVVLPIMGALVFTRVGQDYKRYGKLTSRSTALEILIFAMHGASSYAFLDSRLSAIDTSTPLFGFSLLLIIGGLVMLFGTMGRLGSARTLGQKSAGLHCTGVYRHSRNPQILFYGFVVIGYALLWPSWLGVVWLIIYAVLAEIMVRTEEVHLKKTYGSDYVEYCTRTPRYVDFPGNRRN